MLRLTLSLLLLCTGISGCVAAPAARPNQQWSGAQSGVLQPATRVIRDASGWEALWQQLGTEPPQPLAPGEIAVALFAGERRTGGFRLEVVAVRDEGAETIVEFREHQPRPGQAVTQVLTTPWAVAAFPGMDRAVVARAVTRRDGR